MKNLKRAVWAGSLLAVCGSAGAAEFAMMETADRIADGTFKLSGYPVLVDRAGTDDMGFAVGIGYGLPPTLDVPRNLDLEAQLASYDDGTFLGADLEWNAWRQGRMAFSVGGGLHGADLDDGGTAAGVNGTMIVSYNPAQRLELSAALDAAYDDVNGRDGAVSPGSRFPTDGRYETYYAVPGASYRLTRNIELLGEVGLGLNGNADDYLAAGMSWYFR
jgi:hypothetical protein